MGGAVKQPDDPPPFQHNSLWIKHLNQLLYPGKIINKQSLDNKFISFSFDSWCSARRTDRNETLRSLSTI